MEAGTDSEISSGQQPCAEGCAHYLATCHELIKRHVEVVDLNADRTACRKLQIDFELPTDPAAFLGKPDASGRYHFLFPLLYMRKADARAGFEIRDEHGAQLNVPIRAECDAVSARAAAAAGATLSQVAETKLSVDALEEIFKPIVADTPFSSSLSLQEVFLQIGLEQEEGDAEPPSPEQRAIGEAWLKAGLADVLRMLVEHTLIWVPVHGRPGERRTVTMTQQITLVRRSLIRWIFRDLGSLKSHRGRPFRRRRVKNPEAVLELGDKRYGRKSRRISFSVLAERIGQPIAWTPTEYEFTTIYVKRCQSYHFELICPQGRTPRDLRPASGFAIAEPGKELPSGRTTLTSRLARHDLPGIKPAEDIWFRVSVGVGDGVFPGLWFLSGVITATILWLMADDSPVLRGTPAQIVAGILLVVPALVAALVIGGDGVPITRLVGGARLLFLITGLSAVGAAAVVAGAKPFNLKPDWSWTICAVAATIVTVPLGTSWILSSPLAWSQLKKLRSWKRQLLALGAFVFLAALGMIGLILVDSESLAGAMFSGTAAVYLLVLTIGIMAMANNRVAMPIGRSRGTVVFSCLLAGLTCASLACVELRASIDPGPGPQPIVEWIALGLVIVSLLAGYVKTWIFGWTSAGEGEIHISPQAGKELLSGEAINELIMLRDRERTAKSPMTLAAHNHTDPQSALG